MNMKINTVGLFIVFILLCFALTVMLGGMFYQPELEEFDDE